MVKEIKVSAPKTATGTDENGKKVGVREVTISYDFGNSLEEAAALFGADVVMDYFVKAATGDASNYVRGLLEETKEGAYVNSDEEAVANFAENWKPAIKTGRISHTLTDEEKLAAKAQKKLTKLLEGLTDEVKANLLAKLGF